MAMLYKNTFYIFKTYQSLNNFNFCYTRWIPISNVFNNIIFRVFTENIKFMHVGVVLGSEKTKQKPEYKVKKIVSADGTVRIAKKIYIPRITLITSENGMEILTIDEATKLANRRNLKLIKVADIDPNTKRATYKLSSIGGDITNNRNDKNKNTKDEKVISINSNITDHDLESKLRSILKWISKGHTVKASISGDTNNIAASEKVFTTISNGVANVGRVVQKNLKNGEIKFHIILPKKIKEKEPLKAADEVIEDTTKTLTK